VSPAPVRAQVMMTSWFMAGFLVLSVLALSPASQLPQGSR